MLNDLEVSVEQVRAKMVFKIQVFNFQDGRHSTDLFSLSLLWCITLCNNNYCVVGG